MRIIYRFFGICALLAAGTLLFCSFDDESDLGSGIINDADPDKVNVWKHYKTFTLDSADVDSAFSISKSGDITHNVTGGVMALGKQNGESSFGFVRFVCPPDTDTTNHKRVFFMPTDSLLSVKLVFVRADSGQRVDFDVFLNTSEVLMPDSATYIKPVGTASFAYKDTLVDTLEISDTLIRKNIFSACTSTAKSDFPGTPFCFDITSRQQDSIVRLYGGDIRLLVSVDRDTSDTIVNPFTEAYSVDTALYVVKEDTALATARQKQPVSSNAALRTAVFKFSIPSLWKALEDSLTGSINRFFSAGFRIKPPAEDSTELIVRYGISTTGYANSQALDPWFDSNSVTIKISRDSVTYADVRAYLQSVSRQDPQPESLYLYLKITGNDGVSAKKKEQWQSVLWDYPILDALVHLP
jgi:hypothetical protein